MKKIALSMLLVLAMVLGFVLGTVPAAQAAETIELLYDDRKDLSDVVGVEATTVEITNQVVTSKQVGTDTADENVLVYVDGKIIAVGTGTATIVADGTSYDVTVSAAPISMFLITGHSVGAGQEGNGAQSVVVEAGQAYSSFQRTSLTSAEGGLGYGSATRAGGTGTGALDAFAPGQGGTRGVASAMAYRWNQLTGEKVWIMNLAIPGSCINEWLPGVTGWHYDKNPTDTNLANYAYKYESVVERFGYAQQIMKNEIAAGHYTLSHMAMFYFSGANFGNANYNDWTYDSLKSDYETFWNGLKTDLAMDMDGVEGDETLEVMGIVPLWTATNTDYRQDKALNYIMAASADYPDVFIASDVYRDWVVASGLTSFPAIDYTTQSTAVTVPTSVWHTDKGGTSADSVFCASDTTHLSQVTYNAVGLDMAATYNAVCEGTDAVTAITLQNVDGTAYPEALKLTKNLLSPVIVPALSPEYGSNITITASEGLEIVWPLAIKGTAVGTGTVTFTAGDVSATVNVEVAEHLDHCVCGGHGTGLGSHTCETVTGWIPWGDDAAELTTLPTATGNYYLVADLTNVTVATVADGSAVNLCLNGYNVTMKSQRAYSVKGELGITDCGDEANWGKVYASFNSTYGGLFYTYESNDILDLYAGNFDIDGTFVYGGLIYHTSGKLNIYKANLDGATAIRKYINTDQGTRDGRGGTICHSGGTTNIYGGTITGGQAQNRGGNIYAANGTLNIYGGTISGGKVDPSLGSLTDGMAASGGNIAIQKATVNIYGGTITGGSSTATGGNIHVGNNVDSANGLGALNIKGGTVTGGTATGNGGNIFVAKITGTPVNISGGTVTSGVTSGHGGNIHMEAGTLVTITGGTVSNGTAIAADQKQGGNINMSGAGTLTVSGGTVTGGKATGYGGNICATPGSIINISGTALISNGKTGSVDSGGTDGTTGTGGNINMGANNTTPSKLTITGGTISGGFAKQGGNIHVDGHAYIKGGTVKDGATLLTSSSYCGGNISVTTRGILDISAGTISGGQSFNGGSIFVSGTSNAQGELIISGGTITGGKVNYAGANGGNIFLSGKMTMSGGTITNGRCEANADSNGGNLFVNTTNDGTNLLAVVTMTGGTISNGYCGNGGGGNVQCQGLFYMYGGQLLNGQSKYGGSVRIYRPGHFVLDGGEVLGGVVNYIGAGNGGCAFMIEGNDSSASCGTYEGTLTIKSGLVTGGTNTGTTVNGGAIMVGNRGNFIMEGGTISGGRANNRVWSNTNYIGTGGSIYVYNAGKGTAKIDISGGTIEGGYAGTYGGLLGIRSCTGLIDIDISGGTLIGGEAPYGGLFYLTSGADVDITGGTLVTGNGTTAVDGIYVENADLTISGDAAIDGNGTGIYVNNANSQVTFGSISDIMTVDAADKTVAFGSSEEDVSVKLPCADEGYETSWTDGQLSLVTASDGKIAAVYDGADEVARYGSFDQAVKAAMDSDFYVKLLGDITSSVDVTGELWVDLNGFDLTGITVSGKLYGMDSTTDGYEDANVGTLTATGNVVSNAKTTTARYGSIKRYLAVKAEDGTYTFHRFYIGVTKISIKPASYGMGYKAVFAGDDTVKAQLAASQGYGYNLWLDPEVVVTRGFGADRFVSLEELTLRLENFLDPSLTDAENLERANTKVYANAYVKLIDGTVIESSVVAYNFQEMLEAAAANYDSYTDAQKLALDGLNDQFETMMQGWDIPGMHHSAETGFVGVDSEAFLALFTADGSRLKLSSDTIKVYLTEDIEMTKQINVYGDNNITICLNGHTIHNTTQMFRLSGTVTLYDCCDGSGHPGGIVSDYNTYGPLAYAYIGSELNIYGGEYTATKAVPSGGVIALGNDDNTMSTKTTDTVMNLYGGKIYGGRAVGTSTASGAGGNIVCFHGGTLNMYGGEISGGYADNGGNIYFASGTNDASRFVVNLYGGRITDGEATLWGGNLNGSAKTEFHMYGGEITGGVAGNNGGNAYLLGQVTQITGGTMADGEAVGVIEMNDTYECYGMGGNLYTNAVELTITGGRFIGGKALYGGNLFIIPNSAARVINIEAATFDGGEATFDGGNLAFLNKGTINLNNVTVKNGIAGNDGANIYLFRDMVEANTSLDFPTMNLVNTTVTGGNAADKGSGLYVQEGILTLTGTTRITGNTGSNLYLDAGQTVELAALSASAQIGVSMNIAGRITDDVAYAANLTADAAGMSVEEKDGMLWLDGGLTAAVPELTGYSVGWYRGLITPTEPVPLDGMGYEFTRSQQWTITTELEAGFTVIADETGMDNAIILVSVDTLFIQKELSGNLSAAISDATGIPANRIFYSASHSHCAVNHDSVYEPTREYVENFYKIMTEYAVAAVEDLKAATIQTAQIDVVSQEGYSLNLSRRYIGDDGNAYSSVDSASYPAPSDAARESASDPEMQVIRFVREDGDDVILTNWASHPADYNTSREHAYVSAACWKWFREKVQEEMPGTVCTFFLGAAGDVGSNTTTARAAFTDPAGVTHNASGWIAYGETLGAFAVYALNNNATTIEPGSLKVANVTVECEDWYRASTYKNIDLDLNVITIGGDIAFVTAPYEMYHENGEQIKDYAESLGYETCFVLTNSMGENKYIGSYNAFENDYTDGNLTSFGLRTGRFHQGMGEMLIDQMAQQLASLAGVEVPETIYSDYTVEVVDGDGNAVENVMLRMADGTGARNCSNAEGVITYRLYDDLTRTVVIEKLPDGYTVEDMTAEYILVPGDTITITVTKTATE